MARATMNEKTTTFAIIELTKMEITNARIAHNINS
jgi:hypothetical protein